MIFAILSPPAYYYSQACNSKKYHSILQSSDYDRNVSLPSRTAIAYTFATLAVIFFGVATSLVCTLRSHIPKLYEEYRCVLWSANVILSLPLTFRAIFDGLNSENLAFQNFFKKTY